MGPTQFYRVPASLDQRRWPAAEAFGIALILRCTRDGVLEMGPEMRRNACSFVDY